MTPDAYLACVIGFRKRRVAWSRLRIAHLVRAIEFCDRKIGRLNVTSALRHGRITPVLMRSTPVIATFFRASVLARVHSGCWAAATASSFVGPGEAFLAAGSRARHRPPGETCVRAFETGLLGAVNPIKLP